MVIHVFHVSVSFFNIVLHVSVNLFYGFFKMISCYIRCDQRVRRGNSNFSNGGYWYGACVCGGRPCEEYILVGIVGWLLDNRLVI